MQPPIRKTRQTVLVLEALLSARAEWVHGYALSRETSLASGTLYPLLQRLMSAGWLDTKWAESDTPGRPPRHLYRLNGVGTRLAREFVAVEGPPSRAGQLKPVTAQ